MTKQFKELSVGAMSEAVARAEQGDVVNTLLTVFQDLGVDLSDPAVESIKPWDYEIPMDQWTKICGAFQAGSRVVNRQRDPIAQVNLMLDWVNRGPSAHTEEEA